MNHTDESLYKDFVDESIELIKNSEGIILNLEGITKPDATVVDNLFRAVHTIKGSAGLLGFAKINQLSHKLENVFSLARQGSLVFDKICVDLLLEAIDLLEKLILGLEDPNAIDTTPTENKLLDFYQDRTNTHVAPLPEADVLSTAPNNLPPIDIDLKDIFITESRKYLSPIDELLSTTNPTELTSNLKQIRYNIKSIGLVASILKMENIHQLCGCLIKALDVILQAETIHQDLLNCTIDSFYKLQMLIDDLEASDQYEIEEDINNLNALLETSVKKATPIPEPHPEHAEEAEQHKTTSEEHTELQMRETIRLDVGLIDRLMRLAGELVLIRNQQIKRIKVDSPDVGLLLERLNKTTSEIQETVMKSRLQPVSYIFSKYQRIVRDLSKQLDKEVELKIIEKNVEIDKTYIDELSAPLTHLIRNALDHGIETAEERRRSGKHPVAKICLEARQEASRINIIVSDDGRGVNIAGIAQTAVRLGLSTESAMRSMPKNQILDMIWVPGFTTATQLTDLSGRGVGMDVVRNTISRLGGTIEVATEEGAGTSFTIKLPSSISIVGALILRTSGEYFAIPQINVAEMVCVEKQDYNEMVIVNQEGTYINLRGVIHPIENLNHILQHPDSYNAPSRISSGNNRHNLDMNLPLMFIILKSGRGRFGVQIDQYIGSEEIVVQSLHPLINHIHIYSGSTILGNGRLAFVLNIENISHHLGIQYSNIMVTTETRENNVQNGLDDLLLIFRYAEQEQFALPLRSIRHILSFKAEALQKIGANRFVAVDDDIYKVYGLDDQMGLETLGNTNDFFLILLKGCPGKSGLLAPVIMGTEKEDPQTYHQVSENPMINHSTIINQRVCMVLDPDLIIDMICPKR